MAQHRMREQQTTNAVIGGALEALENRRNFSRPTVESTVFSHIRTMLRTVFGYAEDRPRKVFIGLKNEKVDGVIRRSALEVFCEVNGVIRTKNDLNVDLPKGEKKFDVSADHQQKLTEYLGSDIISAVSAFQDSGRLIPDEIWAGYDLDTEKQTCVYVYNDFPESSDSLPEDPPSITVNELVVRLTHPPLWNRAARVESSMGQILHRS